MVPLFFKELKQANTRFAPTQKEKGKGGRLIFGGKGGKGDRRENS
jgi:hypothetical protein